MDNTVLYYGSVAQGGLRKEGSAGAGRLELEKGQGQTSTGQTLLLHLSTVDRTVAPFCRHGMMKLADPR
jgi:hypothetical protein